LQRLRDYFFQAGVFSFFSFKTTLTAVILSEAKLQRSGQSPRGQAFNLGSRRSKAEDVWLAAE
jgi:hypothetical protein